jgi:hypothetical protein
MGRRRPEEEPIPKPRKQGPGTPIITLGELRREHPWMWLFCRNPACGKAVPVAIVPFIIRWVPDEPVETLKRSVRCERCGHTGATLSGPSWVGDTIGFAPWSAPRAPYVPAPPLYAKKATD